MATSVAAAAGPNLGDTVVTFMFDGDYQVGQFIDGSWWVVGGSGRNITAISPASATGQSGSFTNNASGYTGRTINGAMINPGGVSDGLGIVDPATSPYGRLAQGYDSLLGAPGYSSALLPYATALNVDPGFTGNPISMASPITVAKSVSIATPEQTTRPSISDLVLLTVVSTAPPTGTFRPAACAADKSAVYNESQMRYDILPGLNPALITTLPTVAASLVYVQRWCNIGFTNILNSRNVHALNNYQYFSTYGTPYGQFYARAWTAAFLNLCMNYTPAQLRSLYIAVLQLGIDVLASVNNGWTFPDTGGALMVKFPAVLAALNFPTATNLRLVDAQQTSAFLEDRQVFAVTANHTTVPSTYQPQYCTNNGALGYAVDDILVDASPLLNGFNRGMCMVTHVCANGQIGNAPVPADGSGVAETPGTGGLVAVAATTKKSTGALAAPAGTAFPVGDYIIQPSVNVPYAGGSGIGLLLTFPRHFDRYGPNLIDTPDWSTQYTTGISGTNPYGLLEGSNWDTSYRDICGYAYFGGALAARLITGAVAAWNDPLHFEYVDRMYDMLYAPDTVNTVAHGNGPTQLQADAWAAYRNISGPTAQLVETKASGLNAWLKYDVCLSRRTPPAASSFVVTEMVAGLPVVHNIVNVAIYGRAINLESDTAFGVGNAVTIAYTPPALNPVKDIRGNLLAAVVTAAIAGTKGASLRYRRGW